MKRCRAIGCNEVIANNDLNDFCLRCNTASNDPNLAHTGTHHEHEQESSGGDNDYWVAIINQPKRMAPYSAECEDLIEHFQMSFQEGEAFKAIWRNGMLRLGAGKPGDSHIRNAEKVEHFGHRMRVMEQKAIECPS